MDRQQPDSGLPKRSARRAKQSVTPAHKSERVSLRSRGAREINNLSRTQKSVAGDEYDLSQGRGRREGTLEKAPARLRAERERRRARSRRIVWMTLAGIAATLVLAVVAGAIYLGYMQDSLNKGVEKKTKLNLNLTKAKPQEPYTMLIMGFDKRGQDTGYRADTMLLTRIDPVKKKVWMISLPRDYKVQIPGVGTHKLNAAYALGQEQLAIKTVEGLTGVTINHFMAVNFKGFEKIVDAIGGVEVDVPVAIDDIKADYSKDKLYHEIDAGPQILNGGQALVFVRSRAYSDADFSRMRNQQAFFKALADQVAKMSATKVPGVVTAAVPYLSTDMTLMQLLRTAQDLRSIGSKRVYTDTLPGVWKSPYIYPDEEAKAELLKRFTTGQVIGKEAIEAEKKAKEKAAAATFDPTKVLVTIKNGTTRVGIASQAASILKAQGFKVPKDPTNTDTPVYDKTMVIYKSDKVAAEFLAKYLQPGVKLVENRGMYISDTELLVICGKDWDLSKIPVVEVKTSPTTP